MTERRAFALVDVNSFFASCEQALDPSLWGKPVVVLSNNDGCVVARNAEAKAVGVPMGSPWFKISRWAQRQGVVAKSSNYELYGSMSRRTMGLLSRFSAWQEVYSIDEAFLGLKGSVDRLSETARTIRHAIDHNLGLPVGVGVGPTKTLAKLANLMAKRYPLFEGVFNWDEWESAKQDALLANLPVTELWGVGRRSGRKLVAAQIRSARDLRDADPVWVRKRFNVSLQRTLFELRGISCIPFQEERTTHQQVIFSRSFATPVTEVPSMRQVFSVYAQRISSRLRSQGAVAQSAVAWAATSPFSAAAQHNPSVSIRFSYPTNDPVTIAKVGAALAPKLIVGTKYVRAGLLLTDLAPQGANPMLPIFIPAYESRKIGETLDRVVRKHGTQSIGIGYGGLRNQPVWNMKRELLSRRATTQWDELPVVH